MIKEILKIQENELNDIELLKSWLPPTIFDTHVHTTPTYIGNKIINDSAETPGETFNSFDWPLHRQMLKRIFPEQEYIAATFGFPHLPCWEEDNNYISWLTQQNSQIVPIFRATTATDPDRIRNGLAKKFAGLKMYPTIEQKNRPTKIIEIFPKNILEIVNQLVKPIVIHLPNGLSANLEELITLAKIYPQIKFIIAHMGVVYCYKEDFEPALRTVKNRSNIFLDTAMVSDSQVIAKAIEIIGPKRILFGSDAPFSYFRGGYVIDPAGRLRLYSQQKFSWVEDGDRQYYKDRLSDMKLVHLNIILAIKEAIEVLASKLQKDAKFDILQRNGKMLFNLN